MIETSTYRGFRSIGFQGGFYFIGILNREIRQVKAPVVQKNDILLWLGMIG